jgi:perosamine synthetase
MKVPQFAPFIGEEEYAAIKDCFDANWITEGPKAKEFDERLRAFINAKYAVFAPNGTLALYLALKAAGIKEGDEVIVPDTTFIASGNAVEMLGAVPVFVDVTRRNFQIDVEDCARVLSPRTRGIMPVHLYGMAANMAEVMPFAEKHNLIVVEDAAQALGIRYKGTYCGTFGHTAAFSFFADKTLTTGEGGYVVTSDPEIYENLLYLRNQGRIDRGTFIHPYNGYNFRMTDMQMAIGIVQLGKFDEIVRRKLRINDLYHEGLAGIDEIEFSTVEEGSEFVPFRVTILAQRAHALMDHMREKGVEPRTFFYPLHRQPCFQYLKHDWQPHRKLEDRNFPNAVYGYEHGVCLPSFAALMEEQVAYICEVIKGFYA